VLTKLSIRHHFARAASTNPISDSLTVRVPDFLPFFAFSNEPANEALPEAALRIFIRNTQWLFPGTIWPLRPAPIEDYAALYNIPAAEDPIDHLGLAGIVLVSDPGVDPPLLNDLLALLPPDVAASIVIGPEIDQNPDGTYTLPLPMNDVAQAPEPSSLFLIAVSLLGLAAVMRQRNTVRKS
jgi:hypothetical protein